MQNAGHLCVTGVDNPAYATYLGAVFHGAGRFGRPLINNGYDHGTAI